MTIPEEGYALAIAHFLRMPRKQMTQLLSANSPKFIWNSLCDGGDLGEMAVNSDARGVIGNGVDDASRRGDGGLRTGSLVSLGAQFQLASQSVPGSQVSPCSFDLIDIAKLWRSYEERQIAVSYFGGAGYPSALCQMPDPPPLILSKGRADWRNFSPGTQFVAVVGTRKPTAYGKRVGYWLGREIAMAGVCVVSGLAMGIDTCAHEGSLSVEGGNGIAVVANGLDVTYPFQNRHLYEKLEACGVVVSESILGSRPERWRFPLRNRVMAGISDVVVVVESDFKGGSMSTVQSALELGKTVMAVPGPIGERQSSGTNALIRDGAIPVTHIDDVLTALSLAYRDNGNGKTAIPGGGNSISEVSAQLRTGYRLQDTADTASPKPLGNPTPSSTDTADTASPKPNYAERRQAVSLEGVEASVYDKLGYSPNPLELLVEVLPEFGIGEIAKALGRLEELGLVEETGGHWSAAAFRGYPG